MALSYNTNIFTSVHKWDKNDIPNGVLVSGKLNQYNHQGYPILDAIDIDWDGAYVRTLNSYIYTTEDLINCLNLSYNNFKKYTSYTYLGNVINNISKDITYLNNSFVVETRNTYNLLQDVIKYLNQLDISVDSIKYMTLDNVSFYGVKYDVIVDEEKHQMKYKDRQYYLYNRSTYDYYEVSENYVLTHPNEDFFMGAIPNLFKDMNDLTIINDFIGYEEYDEIHNTYTYTGLIEKLHNYDDVLDDIQEELTYTHNKVDYTYELAYISYSYLDGMLQQIEQNTFNIGYHTSYNIYKPLNSLTQSELENYLVLNNNQVYYNDNGEYKITTYNKFYDGEYYVHYNKIIGNGIEREIEILDDKIYDNSYILYKLNTKTNTPEYISLNIKPDNPGSKERTIETSLALSNINPSTGDTTKGLITNNSLSNSFSYVFNWIILNKE